MRGHDIVQRARALVGCSFRPQGRDPITGLDCVGLALAVYGIAPGALPRNYRLRGDYRDELECQIAVHFTKRRGRARVGDLIMCSVAPDQLHLAISCGSSFVHANARLGRIVETPGVPAWPLLASYRLRPARKS